MSVCLCVLCLCLCLCVCGGGIPPLGLVLQVRSMAVTTPAAAWILVMRVRKYLRTRWKTQTVTQPTAVCFVFDVKRPSRNLPEAKKQPAFSQLLKPHGMINHPRTKPPSSFKSPKSMSNLCFILAAAALSSIKKVGGCFNPLSKVTETNKPCKYTNKYASVFSRRGTRPGCGCGKPQLHLPGSNLLGSRPEKRKAAGRGKWAGRSSW